MVERSARSLLASDSCAGTDAIAPSSLVPPEASAAESGALSGNCWKLCFRASASPVEERAPRPILQGHGVSLSARHTPSTALSVSRRGERQVIYLRVVIQAHRQRRSPLQWIRDDLKKVNRPSEIATTVKRYPAILLTMLMTAVVGCAVLALVLWVVGELDTFADWIFAPLILAGGSGGRAIHARKQQ